MFSQMEIMEEEGFVVVNPDNDENYDYEHITIRNDSQKK